MKSVATSAALLAALALAFGAAGAQAQTLRWSTQGDLQTMDPDSRNESLTNSLNGQVYETLLVNDRQLKLVPGLATEWTQTAPLQWRMKLRANVKFHDGTPFSADDVVFSVKRAQEKSSDIKAYANAMGEPKKIDELTVEFNLKDVNPIFLSHANTVFIMSKAWCEKNNVTKPQDFNAGEQSYAALNANGTGPFMLVSRQPDVKTVYKRNPNWWGKFEGNVQDVIYTPIKSNSTRVAALISGELDFVLDPPPADTPRLRNTPGVKVVDGPENRIIFIGMDQGRDELLYSSVKGKNPFKDQRVRQALYQAVDEESIKTKLMRGQAAPTGAVTPSPLGTYEDPALEKRLPFDIAAGKKLLTLAGYPDGFEVTLDCPNDRYVNDEEICKTLASMWARLGVKVRVNAMPRSVYFAKLGNLDTSMYMLGWGGSVTDAETVLTPIYRTRATGGIGQFNYGQVNNPKMDQLAAQSSKEADPVKRQALIKAAIKEHNEQVHHIPLHRQFIPWSMRSNVEVVHRADNWLEWAWVKIGK
ncbi:MAG TPA: ABC transporter substrate-binding protein [Burkholderiaceae bacterium]|nr:ABC transporter substrate-binding protein [Burkholderiaceae bacterium]